MQRINRLGFQHPRVFVRRESALASYYASPQVTVVNASLASQDIQRGDYFLIGSRADPSIQHYVDNTNLIVIKRQNAVFCILDMYTK
ncbi:MAG: hypothetical protein ACM3QS_00335, partial [Bacteroidota bacterium]